MFGYVRPAMGRLSEEERGRYQALYCGLCHTLGRRCGQVSRLILNYDFPFLAALLSGSIETRRRRCIASPIRAKETALSNPALELAADVSVIYTYGKVLDDRSDSGFWRGQACRAVQGALHPAYRRTAQLRPELAERTNRQLQQLRELEEEQCPSLDAPADTFAQLLQSAALELPEGKQRRVLSQLLYHLGRWIYLVDALDDLSEDAASGNYNPIALRFSLTDGRLSPEARERLAQTLDASIREMAAAFELWDFGIWSPLIESTVYEGLYCVGHAVLNGTFHTARRGGKKEQL